MKKFPYEKAKLEEVVCNFCDGRTFKVLAEKGQDNLRFRSVICRNCGLIFINPRMTADWYFKYYQDEYRSKTIEGEQRTNSRDKEIIFQDLFNNGYRHGLVLAELVRPYLGITGTILEVGSGVGGVLTGLKEKLNREVLGIEPSAPEASFAENKGVHTLNFLIEEVDKKTENLGRFSAIVCTQSLNHLLDPAFFLRWSHQHLAAAGILVLEVMNFRHQLKKAGFYKNAVKIDHPYMFTPATLADFVRTAGFEILYFATDEADDFNLGLPDTHIRLIAKRSARLPFTKISSHSLSWFDLFKLSPFVIYCHYLWFYRLRKLFK